MTRDKHNTRSRAKKRARGASTVAINKLTLVGDHMGWLELFTYKYQCKYENGRVYLCDTLNYLASNIPYIDIHDHLPPPTIINTRRKKIAGCNHLHRSYRKNIKSFA